MSTVPPNIADTAGEYVATEGSSVRLVCDAQGRPEPDVVWSKNGLRLTDADPHYSLDDDGSLEVLSVDDSDTATYVCTAVNVVGMKEKRIRLFVHGQLPMTLLGPFLFTVTLESFFRKFIAFESHFRKIET